MKINGIIIIVKSTNNLLFNIVTCMKTFLSIIFIFFSYPVISETVITCYAKGIWHDSEYTDMQGDIELEQTISYKEKKLISVETSFFKYPIRFDRNFQNLVELTKNDQHTLLKI